MVLRQVLTIFELMDSAYVNGESFEALFQGNPEVVYTTTKVKGEKGTTDFVKVVIKGSQGKARGGEAPTLGIIGRLGGIGARPTRIGLVSDGDGAIGALSVALKLSTMQLRGDVLLGDVIITTHICPNAPTQAHEPVDFMGSPVDILTMNCYEVDSEMDAILSIDTTKGNTIINHKGIAISPTVKEGYILRVSDDLVRLLTTVTGDYPVTFPITTQDITPYGNGVYHLNSILQPAVATTSPVVGVAITAKSAVPGSGTGASHEVDIALAVKFGIEVAKEFGSGATQFYSPAEYGRLTQLYGSLAQLQTLGD
ncbi:DUF1177 domain-containing protein [Vagococcus sp. BWB3-3]|uniref:DUF1177 domain-containing protein n=1 Tax=Vagococcus allomyrinae TaxID=2794353 RepID=A0A940SU57_9ENTE|nr:DUF1177 domain-containing protein [Vagococcus allomyrinae]MBP1043932.1 DUF1177 domain-containing protein [Vagococcus allomyrinae]